MSSHHCVVDHEQPDKKKKRYDQRRGERNQLLYSSPETTLGYCLRSSARWLTSTQTLPTLENPGNEDAEPHHGTSCYPTRYDDRLTCLELSPLCQYFRPGWPPHGLAFCPSQWSDDAQARPQHGRGYGCDTRRSNHPGRLRALERFADRATQANCRVCS